MSLDYYRRFELACMRFLVRKRVGKRFKVICGFRTYEQASEYLSVVTELYPGIYFDIKDVFGAHLDKESSI